MRILPDDFRSGIGKLTTTQVPGHYFDRPNSGTVDTYGRVISINARQQVTLNLNNWRPGCPGEERDAINFPGLPNVGWLGSFAGHEPRA